MFQDILLDKIDKVTLQHEEACKIKEVNDKRGEVVSKILENCLEEEEYADFQYYIDMKTQLALMHAEIRDKVKMGEERLNTLNSTKIDWSILSLTWVSPKLHLLLLTEEFRRFIDKCRPKIDQTEPPDAAGISIWVLKAVVVRTSVKIRLFC